MQVGRTQSETSYRPMRTGTGSRWKRVKHSGLLMLAALTLTGCRTTLSGEIDVPRGADFCTAARAIYYSRHDTPPTIAQIREHNAVGVALKCKWLPKKVTK